MPLAHKWGQVTCSFLFSCAQVLPLHPNKGVRGGEGTTSGFECCPQVTLPPLQNAGGTKEGGHHFWVCPCPIHITVVHKGGGGAHPFLFPCEPAICYLHTNGGSAPCVHAWCPPPHPVCMPPWPCALHPPSLHRGKPPVLTRVSMSLNYC